MNNIVSGKEVSVMLPNLRGAFFLIVTLVLFAGIIAVVAMGTVMNPGRWCERPKPLV